MCKKQGAPIDGIDEGCVIEQTSLTFREIKCRKQKMSLSTIGVNNIGTARTESKCDNTRENNECKHENRKFLFSIHTLYIRKRLLVHVLS